MADRTGQQVDDYRLHRLLGAGAFGEVYLAEHVHDHTFVAVKVLKVQLKAETLKDFLREARTFRLKHPHIVPLLDFGIEGETPFLVMEYAPNGTLHQRHPPGTPVPLQQICSYVKQAAAALQYAHDKRLIHRDVKPQNMLLGRNNEVLLSDFGIAAIAHTEETLSTQEMAGTAPYMAPEQIQGKPRPASDQYALGICVYQWLCGIRPFEGTQWEIISQHMTALPPPLHERVATIPTAVEAVVLRALAKDPHQRFATIHEFATALEQASQHPDQHSIVLPPDTSPAPSLKSPSPDPSAQKDALPHPSEPSPPLAPPPVLPVQQFVAAAEQPGVAETTSPSARVPERPSKLPPVVRSPKKSVPIAPNDNSAHATLSVIRPLRTPSIFLSARRGHTRGKLLLIGLILLVIGSSALFYPSVIKPLVSPVSTLTTHAGAASQSYPTLKQLFSSQLSSHLRPNTIQRTTVIQSVANNNYASAELGYTGGNYGMLRARASVTGPYEQYTLNCFTNSSSDVQCTIQSEANGNFVSAELGYTGGNYGMLRARASKAGPYEQFILNCSNNCTLQSMANGNFVSAELGYTGGNYGMLRARASKAGPWEMFF